MGVLMEHKLKDLKQVSERGVICLQRPFRGLYLIGRLAKANQ